MRTVELPVSILSPAGQGAPGIARVIELTPRQAFWKGGQRSAKLVGMFSGVVRHLQSGYIYHYAFSMIIGVFVLLSMRNWFE